MLAVVNIEAVQPVTIDTPKRPARGAHSTPPRVRPILILVVVLVAALAINVETTIVNVALPTLNSALGASTRGLQWIVDAYNLAFAALVLAGGTVGDKFGRRGTLIAGLTLFAASSVGAALCTSTGSLIGMRLVMGISAALIYPTTLAIITDTFRDPKQRAAAIGVWGAVTGLGVAIGPILGGALLEAFWWGSLFLALAPIGLVAVVGALLFVPRSTTVPGARLDRGGLLLSVVMLGRVGVHDHRGARTRVDGDPDAAGFGVALAAAVAFVWWERRDSDPLIDVNLFTNLRFSAASGAVTVAFFALFGFIFLITQFFQLLQGFGPLDTGVRILPVALSIAVGSVAGTRLAVTRLGTKAVVFTGLLMLTAGVRVGRHSRGRRPLSAGCDANGAARRRARADDGAGHRLDHGGGPARTGRRGFGGQRRDPSGRRHARGGCGRQHLLHAATSVNLSDSEILRTAPDAAQATAREGLAQGLQVAAQSPAVDRRRDS